MSSIPVKRPLPLARYRPIGKATAVEINAANNARIVVVMILAPADCKEDQMLAGFFVLAKEVVGTDFGNVQFAGDFVNEI